MSRQGSDYRANQDQALAAVAEMLRKNPRQFVFIFEPEDPEEGEVGITMFCAPNFTLACVEVLMRAVVESEATVESPPD